MFDPLVVLRLGEGVLWVAGADPGTRSDGSSNLMVAQGYGSDGDYPEGTTFTDELGADWVLTHAIHEGFYLSGIVLEEGEYVKQPE